MILRNIKPDCILDIPNGCNCLGLASAGGFKFADFP